MNRKKYSISEKKELIGFSEAINLVKSSIKPAGTELLPIELCRGRISAEQVPAKVDNPPINISLMDGFAVNTDDTVNSTHEYPSKLTLFGSSSAGTPFVGQFTKGMAIKIFSGALIPEGTNAVVPIENCTKKQHTVEITISAKPGSNIAHHGSEIKSGELIIDKGTKLSPNYVGLAVSAGINKIKVYKKPKVTVFAIGDELVQPGKPLKRGQIYSSNLAAINSWLIGFGISCETSIIPDVRNTIRSKLLDCLSYSDSIITCGGAWKSERDLILAILQDLGWIIMFNHIRIRPSKGTSYGLLQDKPVFCLPGSPASCQKAFLQVALPGILQIGGDFATPFQILYARLNETIKAKDSHWTEFRDSLVSHDISGNLTVTRCMNSGSLKTMASANSMICIPEGVGSIKAGEIIPVQLLDQLAEI